MQMDPGNQWGNKCLSQIDSHLQSPCGLILSVRFMDTAKGMHKYDRCFLMQ